MSTRQKKKTQPWYAQGLRFSCTQCGQCCRGEPGFVWIKKRELPEMASYLNISVDRFLKRYCRKVVDRVSLIEYANGDCVFYTDEGCKIYDVRPAQCRCFPFWQHVLESRKGWDKLKNKCPGIGQGRLYARDEIEAILKEKRDT